MPVINNHTQRCLFMSVTMSFFFMTNFFFGKRLNNDKNTHTTTTTIQHTHHNHDLWRRGEQMWLRQNRFLSFMLVGNFPIVKQKIINHQPFLKNHFYFSQLIKSAESPPHSPFTTRNLTLSHSKFFKKSYAFCCSDNDH